MSKVEEKGAQGWQAPHMPTHTPIQVPRPSEAVSAGAFHPMQQTRCFPSPFGVPSQQPLLFQPTWPQQHAAQWPVPSGAPQHDWDKWSASQLLRISAPMAPVTIVKEEKEEGDSASYDVSASQSPSDAEEPRGDHGDHGEDHIDVEETETTLVIAPEIEETTSQEPPQPQQPEESPMEVCAEPVTSTTTEMKDKEDEATRLLLNFSQQSFMSPADQARISFAPVSGDAADFVQSQLSAFSALEQNQSPTTTHEGASFCRPPGLGPAAVPTTPSGPNTLVCQICGFSSTSKFHYNSHMNTHGDHQCTMCDYTSRTEGRLKKHMKDSHTVEEQLAAGLEIEPKSPTVKPDTSALSTTMASIVDAATAVANGKACTMEEAVTTLAAAMSGEPGLTSPGLNTSATSVLPSALEQIRAFTEKNPLIPEGGGLNLATALGQMGQYNEDSKEKLNQCNSEPRRNSNGKIKQLKCKQCPHISYSKNDQWAHARTHIPSEKQMNCPQCNFVTEYKHHLEYHIRNHLGSKPFQCKKCTYQCVNKSMLNSHMKSHTNVYQFRCMDCTYATKYCHSLKLHLKKYDHRRVPDGVEMGDSPPSQLVNIKSEHPFAPFGLGQFTPTRAPPPVTTLAQTLALTAPIVTSQSLNYASQMLLRQHQNQMEQMNLMGLGLAQPQLKCALCEYQCGSQEELMRHNVTHLMSTQSPIVSLYQSLPQMQQLLPLHTLADVSNNQVVDEHESGNAGDDEMEGSSGSTGSPGGSSKACDEESRRKKGFKVDQIGERLLGKSPSGSECGSHCEEKESGEEHMESSMSPPEPSSMVPMLPPSTVASAFMSHEDQMSLFRKACLAQLTNMVQNQQEDWRFQCHHCKMAFQEQALYHIHMGYHGYEHPFKCNRCGHIAPDSLSFNLHLLQASHQ